MQGRSLLVDAAPRETFGAAYRFSQRMARDERFKLIRYWQEAGPDGTLVGSRLAQLFDLERDPWETANLAHLPNLAPEVRRLDAALHAWQREVDDPLMHMPVA